MDIQSMIRSAGGVEAIAGQLGVSGSTAQAGIDALLPAVLGGFKKSAQGETNGLGGLIGMIGGLGGGGLLDNVVGSQPTAIDAGNNVLGQIFGSRDTSRAVADHAASASGLDSGMLKKMLPMLAMMVAGAMAKGAGGAADSSGGGLGGMIGGLLGGMSGGGQAVAPGAGGLGGLVSMLDLDGDGNPLDDIMGMVTKFGARGA